MPAKPAQHTHNPRQHTEPPLLSVSVVLHYSPLEHVRATLDCLTRALTAVDVAASITVIDQSQNAVYAASARDLCRETLGNLRLEYEFRVAECNLGYGAGHNQAISKESDYHLVLNPDVELAEDALSQGITELQAQPNIIALAPRATGSDGTEEFLAKRYPSATVLLVRALNAGWLNRRFEQELAHYELRDLNDEPLPQDVTLISGCCMLLRSEALREVGGFDERFFLYFEDYDLSLRLAAHGRVVRFPPMKIVHHGGNASRKGLQHIRFFVTGAIRFFSRWGWRWT